MFLAAVLFLSLVLAQITFTSLPKSFAQIVSTDDLLKSNSGQHLVLNLTKEGQSYVGTFNIVLNSAQSPR
jgi:hypothetical protein